MQPNDDESPPAAQDGAQNQGPEPEATPPVAGENHKPGTDNGPTARVHFMSLEELKRLVQENSEEELAQHVRLFTIEQIDDCCITDPTFSLLFCKELLSRDQLEYCIERDPLTALTYASGVLTEEQIHSCYRLRPDCALRCYPENKLDADFLDFCIRKEPGIALELVFSWDPRLSLTDEQWDYCFREAPPHVLKHPDILMIHAAHLMNDALFEQCALADPSAALYFAAGRMSETLLNQCALAAPGLAIDFAAAELSDALLNQCASAAPRLALQHAAIRLTALSLKQCALAAPVIALRYAAGIMNASLFKQCALAAPVAALRYATGIMNASLFKQCALAAPVAALRYATGIMNASLFKQCALAKPWTALRYASARLSDADILRYSAGRGSRIRCLLVIQPRHPLARRLLQLRDHLRDPVTVAAVGRAIASEI